MSATAQPSTSLLALRGVGPELARRLRALGIESPRSLAALYPRAYKDWRQPQTIADIVRTALLRAREPADADSSEVITVGRIVRVSEVRARVPIVSAELEDDTGRITATWFGRRGVTGRLAVGERLFVHGRASLRRSRSAMNAELNVLHHARLEDGQRYRGAMVPVYPASKELPSRTIATLIERNFEALGALIVDAVPGPVLEALGFGSLHDAWRTVHRPPTPEAAAAARERVIFEEFFALALAAARKRAQHRASGGAHALAAPPGLLARFEGAQPFALTAAQRRVIEELWRDMGGPSPMNRLLQGDVGSGKTLVAAAAIVLAAAHGVQSALMAPTEILAAQHARKLAPLLLPFNIRVDALFGSVGARERSATRARLESGACDLVVGTHALLEEDVVFRELGLAIIDEQHRFGVAQRAKLRAKSRAPHTLHMTATPIPRTLAQTKFADLDLSILDELPPGRTPIETYVLRESRKPSAYAFVRKNIERGRQAYIVAPAIDESESALTSALAELEHLRRDVFPDLRVELLHGRLPSRQKDAVMSRFARHEADVLLATTVVEVGVDVPNASVMVILDAHRYGLAQLHQLRGRVGRGVARSYCVLIAPAERAAVERLDILAQTADGFIIAEEDLRLRGEGEFSGTAQAGGGDLLGSLVSDFALYMRAKAAADALVAADPGLARPEHHALRSLLDGNADARAMFVSS
ncbi:MAG: ATP-dependent DNA helicase RecG [Candidatus Eremiobacteraeota bacterium]|nr:ATP-dependent DNA helicase RecG [Candidatus Eremiobacteraeota bacterium]MBC5801597.1 ATP-dependent DNA helicase RecG [Candidatus Eremiobacteraeota bacterium]MBC5822639.1 ATP-dependent DNA helicase RecG [Candidatus Eremiobacteraeota bacterium]